MLKVSGRLKINKYYLIMEYRFTINQKTNIFFSEEDLLEHINLRKDLGFNDSAAIIEMERRLSLKNFLQKNEDFSTG